MSNVIEETLKALAEFESQLDSAKASALEAKRQMVKEAADLAEKARAAAVAEAQRIAKETVSKARREAEAEAESLRNSGLSALKDFEDALSKHKPEAVELVTRALLGETE
jgi:vacuolar-type H+-ATPase subunit H